MNFNPLSFAAAIALTLVTGVAFGAGTVLVENGTAAPAIEMGIATRGTRTAYSPPRRSWNPTTVTPAGGP